MPKRYLTGGGKDPKNPDNSTYYSSNSLKIYKYFANKFLEKIRNLYQKLTFARYDKIGGVGFLAAHLLRKLLSSIQKLGARIASSLRILNLNQPCTKLNSKGSILIEFAICMPILIILLFYIHDLIKIKRYYSQTEFVAQQFANIIQNISQKRSNKKITLNDIRHAASLAFLTIYPGTTMYRIGTSGSRHELSHAPRICIFYVKGESGGKVSYKWHQLFLGESIANPKKWVLYTKPLETKESSVKQLSNVSPSEIYPTLKIGENEEKIIVEVNLFNALHVMNENEYVESDKQEALAKKAFKCRLVAPRPLEKSVNDTKGWYFPSVVIFTPKPGLFDETPPS